MATIINAPSGIVESKLFTRNVPQPASAATLAKRKEMKEMLVKRFCQQYGSNPVRAPRAPPSRHGASAARTMPHLSPRTCALR